MTELTATDFPTVTVIASIAAAGAAILGVKLVKYGWNVVTAFFGR